QPARIPQLPHRPNQFNFSTRRRTENEVQSLCGDGSSSMLAVSVRDRFGDYGLVGGVIFQNTNEVLNVDTFLLSCRVLGKGIEHRILARLGQIAQDRSCAWIEMPVIP